MLRVFLFWFLAIFVLWHRSGFADDTLPLLPILDCRVTAIHGYFPTYSPLPVPRSKVQIDISHLTKTRGALGFVPQRRRQKKMVPSIPYDEPFKLVSVVGSPDGQLIRVISSSGANQSLTLDLRYFDKVHQKSYISLLYEVPIVAGICFLECHVKP